MFFVHHQTCPENSNALSFYRSKSFGRVQIVAVGSKSFWLDPNQFGWVQIILVGSKSIWLDPNHFGQVQVRLFWANFYDLNVSEMIQPDQNELNLSKTIGIRQK